MIREFAVQPELLGDWHEFRYLREKFGVDKARVIAEYPSKWRKLVHNSTDSFSEIQRLSLVEWLSNKDSFLVPSGRDYPIPDDWLQSTEAAHDTRAFQAILANINPRNHGKVLVPTSLPIEDHELFQCDCERIIPRTVASFIGISGSLLKWSKQIIFVDPYFKADREWGEPLKAMLSCTTPAVSMLRYCAKVSPRGETEEHRISELKEGLPRYIPQGMRLEVVLLERTSEEDMHNRYILTERGGLKFPWGLATSNDGESDVVNLMEEKNATAIFQNYSSLSGRVGPDPFIVEGRAR